MSDLTRQLSHIDEDVTYYALTLTADETGRAQTQTQTQYVGPGSKPLLEMRAASPVDPQAMRDAWRLIGQRSVVVNTDRALAFLLRAGGNAVVAEPVFARRFGSFLIPVECATSRFGEGVRPLSTVSAEQLRHAPTPKLRNGVLKRDQYRCMACGQRPAEDVNIILHVHHVRPHGQGGLTEEHNLLTLCHTCHTGLDPHYEMLLLGMIPDGLVMPYESVHTEVDSFDDAVRRYREAMTAQVEALATDR